MILRSVNFLFYSSFAPLLLV